MATWQPDLAPFLGKISRLNALLKTVTSALHADLGLNPSMRALIGDLAACGPRTVPQLARERNVSRQHVQAVANDLLAAGLAEALPNAAHRRSALVGVTPEGRRRLRLVGEREAEVLAQIAPAVSPADLGAALRLMEVLERDLSRRAAHAPRAPPRQT
jgi:DNA-binding MarR family transcriptional regulator